jgi:hypothetical protein
MLKFDISRDVIDLKRSAIGAVFKDREVNQLAYRALTAPRLTRGASASSGDGACRSCHSGSRRLGAWAPPGSRVEQLADKVQRVHLVIVHAHREAQQFGSTLLNLPARRTRS